MMGGPEWAYAPNEKRPKTFKTIQPRSGFLRAIIHITHDIKIGACEILKFQDTLLSCVNTAWADVAFFTEEELPS